MNAFRAWWYRIFNDPEPGSPRLDDIPLPAHLASDHAKDCAEQCCWEDRLNEMVIDYDWDRAEHEMRSKR